MKKIPKLVKSVRSSKEITLSEDEMEIIGSNKASESIEDIDYTINQLLKNPPPDACPFNDFKDVHNLTHEGINLHRLRTNKDVFEIDMVQVFGPARGRSKYFFAMCMTTRCWIGLRSYILSCMENLLCQNLNY
jgi:hypothetical protein